MNEILMNVVVAVLGLLGTVLTAYAIPLARKYIKKLAGDQANDELIDALMVGIVDTYDTFVSVAKKASADSKLTSEERKEAMALTLASAKKNILPTGAKLLAEMGKQRAKALVEQLLNRHKPASTNRSATNISSTP